MISRTIGAHHERPAGDPVQLRRYAHEIGSMGSQVRRVLQPYPGAVQTATNHLPLARVPDFVLIGNELDGRRRRLLHSLGRMSAALLDYARALERAQDAVDAANRWPLPAPGPPVTTGEQTGYATVGGVHAHSDMVVNPFRQPGEPMHSVEDHLVRDPLVRPHQRLDDADDRTRDDVEAALTELRVARRGCIGVMRDIEREWPGVIRPRPIPLPIFRPIRLPLLRPVDPMPTPGPIGGRQYLGAATSGLRSSLDTGAGILRARRYDAIPMQPARAASALPA